MTNARFGLLCAIPEENGGVLRRDTAAFFIDDPALIANTRISSDGLFTQTELRHCRTQP